jgi:DME family drug/metabolite transporter
VRGLLLVVLAGVIWGTIGPGVSLVHEWSGLGPVAISAYRAAVAVVVLVGAVLVAGRVPQRWSAARGQWRRVGVVGVLTAAFQLLFFVGVVATGVSVATVVCLGFAPVLLLVLDCVRRRRLPAPGSAVTVAAAVVGLVLVSVVGGAGDVGPHPGLGVLASLASGAAYGLSAEVSGTLSRRLDTLTMTTSVMVVAAVVLVPGGLLLTWLRGERLGTTDGASWLGVVYLGVVTMAVAWAVFFTGLRSTASGAAMIATLVEPVTAVLIAVVLLAERLTPAGVVGCVLILAAVASLGRRPTEPAPAPQ